jgi:cell division septation protein DedD
VSQFNFHRPAPWVVLAAALAIAAPAAAGTGEGYAMWQKGDFFGAVREWRTAAIAGDPIAQFNLARAYQLGRGVPTDLKMAESWFAKAAAQGHQPSRDNYGLTLFQNGDREMAMPYISDAAKRGDPRAQYVLGTALFNGDIVKKDWPLAYALMTRASAGGIGPASESLAQMDKFIPADQRQKGLTLARTLETIKAQVPDEMIGDAAPAPRPVVQPAEPSVGAPPIPAAKPAPKAPVAPPAAPAAKPLVKPAAAPTGNWKVQLGAFGDSAKAHSAWSAMQRKTAVLGPLTPTFTPVGKMTRLQAGPLPSRAAADKICATVSPCFPVAP